MSEFCSSDALQASHLKKETITYEEKEQQLVSDCVKELRKILTFVLLLLSLLILIANCAQKKQTLNSVHKNTSVFQVSQTVRWSL